jgi:tRNA(Ile)-lysidine synthase
LPSAGASTAEQATGPLSVAELATTLAAIGGFEARPLVAVALSGGPDSLALMLLADRWARERGGAAYGVTVDHGLRRESREEARCVAGWLTCRGIPHAILRWEGEKPASGIQEAARAARYELLANWCRDRGVLHLLTAHHPEDQAETYMIRNRAGSGADGLAAMPAVRELAGCRLVRPLLAIPRARLAAFLSAEQQPFLIDPSNLNPAFERARLRAAASAAVSIDEIIGETRTNAQRRIAREAALDRLVGRVVALHPAGFADIDADLLATADDDIAERLLARVAACIGGKRYPPRRARRAGLRGGLRAAPQRARTLGGCRFVPWRGRILVLRELAAAAAPVNIAPGEEILWDRRFAVSLAPEAGCSFRLDYLRRSAAMPAEQRPTGLPTLVDPTLPALWDAAGLAAVPALGYRRAGAGALPELLFHPANPLTQVGFCLSPIFALPLSLRLARTEHCGGVSNNEQSSRQS